MEPELTSYHFDLGNSTDGPIGFCARVNAHDKKEAVKILQQRLRLLTRLYGGLEVMPCNGNGEYIIVYFGEDNLSAKDIDETGG
jgi:hypothetical protein